MSILLRRKKKEKKKRKKNSKSKSNKQTGNTRNCPKTGPATDDDDVIFDGESTKQTKYQKSKEQETKQSTSQQKRTGPGHEKVICRGHKTLGEVNDAGGEQGFCTQNATDSPNDGTATSEKRST